MLGAASAAKAAGVGRGSTGGGSDTSVSEKVLLRSTRRSAATALRATVMVAAESSSLVVASRWERSSSQCPGMTGEDVKERREEKLP